MVSYKRTYYTSQFVTHSEPVPKKTASYLSSFPELSFTTFVSGFKPMTAVPVSTSIPCS